MKDSKKIVATIEARMTSSRLPGKVLMPLVGVPALERIIERLRQSRYIDEVVVACTANTPDDAIVELCKKVNCRVYRGNEDDVLVRVLDAAQEADVIVEVCADQPFIDPAQIDQALDVFFAGGYDYVGNHLPQTFPLGFEIKIFPTKILDEVNRVSQDPYDHEHVSLYIYNHPEKYKIGKITAEGSEARPDIRLTLDTKEDYELINTVYEKLLPTGEGFGIKEVVGLFEREPALLDINKEVKQKDPYHRGFLER